MAERVALAIIGGGCAGLSLASRLARGGYRGRVAVIEPRERYTDDRSWAFWAREPHRLASASWDQWRFSRSGEDPLVHQSRSWRYQYVRASDFYADAVESLAAAQTVDLMLGAKVTAVTARGGAVKIETTAGPLAARRVVDTRPPARSARAQLYQGFLGVEVEAPGRFDPSTVGLMEEMRLGEHGFEFTYVLPFTKDRALVEHTVFSTRPAAPQSLAPNLDALLARRGLAFAREVRREGAILPMGLLETPSPPLAGVVRAGAGAGAMRPATGYAFRRIEAWADHCAQSLLAGNEPVSEAGRSDAAHWFDSVFLRALSRDGAPAPDWFFSMARGLGADGFAHFMSDEARARDYGAVLTSLPPAPFIAAALRAA
ncbi:MAG: lycopene cyclase family protein [Oceanicaulis sp.]